MALKLIPPNPPKYKYYYIRGTDPTTHQRIQTSTGVTTLREARLVLHKYERDMLNGRLGLKTQTFTEAACEYVEGRRGLGTSQREAIIGVENRDGSIRPCLVSDFGDTDCRKIDQARVNRGYP